MAESKIARIMKNYRMGAIDEAELAMQLEEQRNDFPMKVQFRDDDSEKVIKRPEDLEPGRLFTVLEINVSE